MSSVDCSRTAISAVDVDDDDSREPGGVPAQPAEITATSRSNEHRLAHLYIEPRIATYRQR